MGAERGVALVQWVGVYVVHALPGLDSRITLPPSAAAILHRPMPSRSRSPRRRGFIRAFNYLAFMPLASRAPTYGRLLAALLGDARVPWTHKAILGLAVGYVLSPVDLVPDFVPVLLRHLRQQGYLAC